MPPFDFEMGFSQLESEEISTRSQPLKKQSGRQFENSKRALGSKGMSKQKSTHSNFVYLRVRPLLPSDSKEDKKATLLEHLVTDTEFPESHTEQSKHQNGKDKSKSIYAMNGQSPIGGFSGILGTNQTNLGVFSLTFLPHLSTIMQGGTTSLFCYGYTGAGKTYTTLGHMGESGLYRLAAEELWVQINELNKKRIDSTNNSSEKKKESEEEPYLLQASVVEVYNDEVYDILGGKAKCSLRKNARGQLLIRGATRKHIFSEEEAKANGFDYTITTSKLTTFTITNLQDLDTVQEMAVKYRKTGSSTQNEKSSRSHAIFRLDIVNQTLLEAQDDLEVAESTKPALQTAYDKKRSYRLRQQLLKIDNSIKEKREMIDFLYKKEAEKKTPFGGRLLLVDLAGADSDDRHVGEKGLTINERKESAAINISLMALKDCIKALNTSSDPKNVDGRRPSSSAKSLPFRNSSLTRLLEEVLTPRENRDSTSIMVVNVSPASTLKPKTFNSLRYGELFSGGGKQEVKPRLHLKELSKLNQLKKNAKKSLHHDATLIADESNDKMISKREEIKGNKKDVQILSSTGINRDTTEVSSIKSIDDAESTNIITSNRSLSISPISQHSLSKVSDDRREPRSSSRNLQEDREESSIAKFKRSGILKSGISSIPSPFHDNSSSSRKSGQSIVSSPISRQSSNSCETQSSNEQKASSTDRLILEAQSFKTCRTRNPRSLAERKKLIKNMNEQIPPLSSSMSCVLENLSRPDGNTPILKRPTTAPHKIKSIEIIFSHDEGDRSSISPINLLQGDLNGKDRSIDEERSHSNSACSLSSVSTSSGRSIGMANSMELLAEARKRLDDVKKRAEERSFYK